MAEHHDFSVNHRDIGAPVAFCLPWGNNLGGGVTLGSVHYLCQGWAARIRGGAKSFGLKREGKKFFSMSQPGGG